MRKTCTIIRVKNSDAAHRRLRDSCERPEGGEGGKRIQEGMELSVNQPFLMSLSHTVKHKADSNTTFPLTASVKKKRP